MQLRWTILLDLAVLAGVVLVAVAADQIGTKLGLGHSAALLAAGLMMLGGGLLAASKG